MGESAAMGAAGVIIWDKFFSAKTQSVLGAGRVRAGGAGPVRGERDDGGAALRHGPVPGRGRCVRRDPEGPAYLHLPPASFLLLSDGAGGLQAVGEPAPGDLEAWRRDFRCQWYEALEGTAADQESPLGGAGAAGGRGGEPPAWGERVTPPAGPSAAEPTAGLVEGLTARPTVSPLNRGTPALTPPLFTLLLSALPFLTPA
ncbi:hypothetical protein AAFF_G00059390 [Aldrovandia affinis]|uniref:hyaluronoglucosaminidase n=1 Tax=Aldrovandia affinis TaxID=143900 RepID=A0AAD7RZX5_9TELE|nr:hypothetical protein AAFF_G00059390 [Aldrovandia affinis]